MFVDKMRTEKARKSLRQRLNEGVRSLGNKVYDGLGDLLIAKMDKKALDALGLAGALYLLPSKANATDFYLQPTDSVMDTIADNSLTTPSTIHLPACNYTDLSSRVVPPIGTFLPSIALPNGWSLSGAPYQLDSDYNITTGTIINHPIILII